MLLYFFVNYLLGLHFQTNKYIQSVLYSKNTYRTICCNFIMCINTLCFNYCSNILFLVPGSTTAFICNFLFSMCYILVLHMWLNNIVTLTYFNCSEEQLNSFNGVGNPAQLRKFIIYFTLLIYITNPTYFNPVIFYL